MGASPLYLQSLPHIEDRRISEQSNVALVQKALAAFGQGDLETAVSCFAGDVAIQHPMPKEIWPWCGRSSGRRALANFLSEMSRVLSFEVFEAREFIAQGDKVVVNVFERPRVKATGKVFDNDYVHIYTIRDGLIAEVKIFEATAMVQAALRPD